ncbi:MAG TPA: protoporphyrinogen oxidase, partial [Polyangia bacterium]|nr:protoporphyrinogen oxidase [Polyangia bacterium]
ANFIEPLVSGVFAGDYARLSAKSAFPRVVALEREHGSLLGGLRALERKRRRAGRAHAARLTTLAGGMAALPSALARELGDRVRTGVAVAAVEKRGAAFTLATSAGPLDAERVMLALPPDAAAALAAPLDAAIADAYTAIPQVSVAAVSLGWARGDVGHALDGFGFLVPRRERLRLLGCVFSSSAFPSLEQAPAGHVLVRCLMGGAQDPHALELTDEELIAAAREALRPTLAVSAAPAFSHVARWPRGIAQYEVGHAARVAAIEERGARIGLFSTGAALRGVGVNDVVREAAAAAERACGAA